MVSGKMNALLMGLVGGMALANSLIQKSKDHKKSNNRKKNKAAAAMRKRNQN